MKLENYIGVGFHRAKVDDHTWQPHFAYESKILLAFPDIAQECTNKLLLF